MKINTQNKLLLLSFIIITGIGFIGFTIYRSYDKLLASAEWVQHTEEVIFQSDNIQSLVKDIQNASRGFVITGDSSFLEPGLLTKTIFLNMDRLREFTNDNPIQQNRVDSLNFYIHKCLHFSSHSVELRSKYGLDSAIAHSATKQGKHFMDRIMLITDTIQSDEGILLKERKKESELSASAFNKVSVIMFLLILLGSILLLITSRNFLVQNKEKAKRAAELMIANEDLAFENEEKEKRAAELIIANEELAFQNGEKEKRAAELIIANGELAFENSEKEKRAAELIIANKDLAFENVEKENRAAELIIANKELAFQNGEKEKRAAELIVANQDLAFENVEKENRAAELIIANKELAFQNEEKGNRAAELVIANKELAFQNKEKEDRASELIITNTELKDAEEKLIKRNRLYSFISHINQTIVHVTDEKTLFNRAVRIAVEMGEFKMAWIGITDGETEKIKLVASCGASENEKKMLSNYIFNINGPTKKIMEGAEYYVVSNIQRELTTICNDGLNEESYKSCISLPVKKSGNVIGTFNIFSVEENFFDIEEIKTLTEAAKDLSFALDTYEKEKQRTKAEENLGHSETKLKEAQSIARTGNWELDFADNILILSDEGCRIFGISPTQNHLSFKEWSNMVHPDDKETVLDSIKKSQDSLIDTNYEHRIVLADGTVKHIFSESKFQLDANGNATGLFGITQDVSEKKEAEEQKQFNINNLDALINNTDDLMWSVDIDFKLITYNQPFYNIIKLMSGIEIKKGDDVFSVVLSPEQSSHFKISYARAFTGEVFTEVEYIPSPIQSWSEISFYPIFKGEEVIGTACHSRDVTDRKLAELERTKITNDLIQRNKDLEQFSYIISHNLRAPVANIIGLAEVAQNENLKPKTKKDVMNGISQSVKKLDGVISDLNNILNVKREVSQMKEVVYFSKIAGDIHSSIENLIEKENAVLIWDFSGIDEMLTLKSYLHSIFYNLISNSLKYRNPDTPLIIEIKSRKLKNKVELVFSDNGMGIDLEKKGEQVFGLYKRFHANGAEGKGMGLYMVKTQVESLGGRINIESEVNKGTTFTIEFET